MSKGKQVHTGGQKSTAPKPQNRNPKKNSGQTVNAPAPPEKKNKALIIGIAGALLIVVAILVASAGGGGRSSSGGAPVATEEEARYIGRLLPAGYAPPAVAEPAAYTSTIEMTELTATLTDTQVKVPLADVTNAKIALVQYEGAKSLPVMAFVKPSGKLFVGVSFCPPCQGEWQTIQPDGTLTCNSCGTKRDLETQVGISGACKLYPIDEIPVTIVDGEIVFERAVLDNWTAQPLDRKVG